MLREAHESFTAWASSSGGNNRSLATTYDHSSDKGIASKQPVCRSNVVSGSGCPRIPSRADFPRQRRPRARFRFRMASSSSFLLGQDWGVLVEVEFVQAAAVIGRGFAHSERRPQLKHTYCSMISPVNRSMACLDSKSSLGISALRGVFVMHTSKVKSHRLGSPTGETASARGIEHWSIPMSIVFPNSEVSPGGLHSRSDLNKALELRRRYP